MSASARSWVARAAPQPCRNLVVLAYRADACINDQQHKICRTDRSFDLSTYFLVKVISSGHPAAGIDNGERHSQPFGFKFFSISRDAGAIFRDRHLLSSDAVEER